MENQYLHEVVITAIIIKDKKYLVTKRSATKKRFPNMWTVPGGKLESKDYLELPKDTKDYWYNVLERTLRREVKEEVGLDVKLAGEVRSFKDGSIALLAPRFMNRHYVDNTHEHIVLIYFATVETDQIQEGVVREMSDEIRWFTKEDIEDPRYELRDNIKYYAEEALKELGK